MVDIIIPTCKSVVKELYEEIERNTPEEHRIIATCKSVSAAKNRNIGLNQAKSEFIVMMDDDMTGFYPGWLTDMQRWWGESVVLMSSRLLKPNLTLGYMLCEDDRMNKGCVIIGKREVPTACIMFRNDGVRFDENYIGSGFEDNDFCRQLQIKYPDGLFVVNNECRLIHINEKKNQGGEFWQKNKAYYYKKWK